MVFGLMCVASITWWLLHMYHQFVPLHNFEWFPSRGTKLSIQNGQSHKLADSRRVCALHLLYHQNWEYRKQAASILDMCTWRPVLTSHTLPPVQHMTPCEIYLWRENPCGEHGAVCCRRMALFVIAAAFAIHKWANAVFQLGVYCTEPMVPQLIEGRET